MFNYMVEHTEQLDRIFKALGDPVRRDILAVLKSGPRSVGELAEPYVMSFAAVSKHIGVLEDAGLLNREKRGRERWCSLDAGPMQSAEAWLQEYSAFWSERLDMLESGLKEEIGDV